jgi:hypothetical protein
LTRLWEIRQIDTGRSRLGALGHDLVVVGDGEHSLSGDTNRAPSLRPENQHPPRRSTPLRASLSPSNIREAPCVQFACAALTISVRFRSTLRIRHLPAGRGR